MDSFAYRIDQCAGLQSHLQILFSCRFTLNNLQRLFIYGGEILETFTMLLHGFSVSMAPSNLLACMFGVLLGTLVGVLPGIGTVGAISLLLPFSYSMDSTSSLIMFAGI